MFSLILEVTSDVKKVSQFGCWGGCFTSEITLPIPLPIKTPLFTVCLCGSRGSCVVWEVGGSGGTVIRSYRFVKCLISLVVVGRTGGGSALPTSQIGRYFAAGVSLVNCRCKGLRCQVVLWSRIRLRSVLYWFCAIVIGEIPQKVCGPKATSFSFLWIFLQNVNSSVYLIYFKCT